MDQMWFVAALWLALALVAVLAANRLRISTALSEIVVGTVAQLVIGALVGRGVLNAKAEWITFLAGTGAIVLTFLAGAELDSAVFRAKWRESTFLMHKGVSGATATRAYSGFGSHHLMHTPKVEVLAQHLPIRIEFIETAEKVEEILPTLYEMVSDGLIEVQDTTVVKFAHKSAKPEPKLPHTHKQGPATLLRVYLGEADRWHGQPLYEAIVSKLRMMDIAGATVYRGILGYGAKGHEHKRSVLHPMRDLPIMLSVIDSPDKIPAAAQAIEGMLEDGLIVTSDVEMVRLVRGKTAMEAPDAAGTTR